MKTISKLGLMLALAGSTAFASCEGSYYVADQPIEPVYEHGVAPYEGAIWIDGEWGYRGGRYEYTRGHWDHPRPNRTYVRGSWEHNARGYTWHRGHWN